VVRCVPLADRALQILEWAFGKRVTPAERLRKNQRLLDKAIRELDQQRVKLEKQEKTLVAQIRQSAQKGQMGACKVQAKDLVRTRRYLAPPLPMTTPFPDHVRTDMSKSFMRCAPTSKRSRSGSRSVSSAPESAEPVADVEPDPRPTARMSR
jgi:hypothetical protein